MSKALNNINCNWIENAGEADHIVVSSRIRLARNLSNYVFPNKLSKEQSEEVVKEIEEVVKDRNNFSIIRLNDLSELSKTILVEKHLISPHFAAITNKEAAVIINDEGSISIMINEEDHLRLQCIMSGLSLLECFEKISQVDDDLEKKISIAYDSQLGYLTSCPTNLGTAMRASVMLHLPALVKTKNITKAFESASKLGFVARGIYGEGTDGQGSLFQISNQITLGRSEKDIIASLSSLVKQLVEYEINAREYLIKNYRTELEDSIGRAFGILSNARRISTEEAMDLLSNLRLGSERDIVVKLSPSKLNKIMVDIQPASLQKLANERLSANKRDVMRATVLRQRLKQ